MRLQSLIFAFIICPAIVFAREWGIVIDCGSTGSRVKLYNWDENDPSQADQNLLERSPGIADAKDLGNYFGELVIQSKRWIPENKWNSTPIRAFATAGMRLLKSEKQLEKLKVIRNELHKTPFIFRNDFATDISYVGTLDLGGASTQITFAPLDDAPIMADAYVARVGSLTPEHVYAHSYLDLGQNEAIKLSAHFLKKKSLNSNQTIIKHPCFNEGFRQKIDAVEFEGTGNYHECVELVTEMMPGTENICLQPPCILNGVYQPKISKETKFIAISGFFYTIDGLMEHTQESYNMTPKEISTKTEEQCAKSSNSIEKDKHARNYCFGGVYIAELLKIYGFTNDSNQVTFINNIENHDLGWTLGAQLYLMKYRQKGSHLRSNSVIISPVLFYCTFIIGVFGWIIAMTLYLFKKRPSEKEMEDKDEDSTFAEDLNVSSSSHLI